MKLDELEQTLIRAARADLSPGAADRERNRAAVWAQLGGVSQVGLARPGSEGQGSGPGPNVMALGAEAPRAVAPRAIAPLEQPSSFLGRWGGWMALSLGLLLGAGVGGGFGFGWGWQRGQAALHGAVSSGAVSSSVASGTGSGASLGADPSLGALADHGRSGPDSLSGAGPAEAAPAGLDEASRLEGDGTSFDARGSHSELEGAGLARSAKGNAKRRTANASGSSLAEELAMLQRARRAIADENGRLALGIVQELDERLPSGLLMEERDATRILSLCQLQRSREARKRAAVFLARYAGSVYAPRVRQSCIAEREPLAPNP